MNIFLQLLINGLIAGAIYSLVSVGFALIYTTNRFIHFAHGSVVAWGAYILFYLFSFLKINFWISFVLTLITTALIGFLINVLVYQKLRKERASSSILLIASIAVMVILESLILISFGADVQTIDLMENNSSLLLWGAFITPLQIIIIITALLCLFIFIILMKKTSIGVALRAVSDNSELLEIVGIPSKKIYNYSFIVGSLLAGMAGILIGLEQGLDYTMGSSLVIKGFVGSIIGGISVPGAILGSFILGLAENFGIWYLPSGYKDAIAFFLLFLFLLILPKGLLGINRNKSND